jgi:C6 transcription factor Pro1
MMELRVAQEVVSFRFMGGTIIYLDIIASITTGTVPRLLSYHPGVIASNSQTKLENIMGCKNWVMVQIGRIAALHGHEKHALQLGRFDHAAFNQTADSIGKEIESGLARGALGCLNISEGDFPGLRSTVPDQITLTTQIFAYMASVYLHLVIHGFQRLEILDTTISGAMKMLQTQIPSHLLPALVCPLYLIECVAGQGDEQQFFRNTYSSSPFLDPLLLEHRGRISPILEEIWSRRRTIPVLAWDDILKLTHDLLLF